MKGMDRYTGKRLSGRAHMEQSVDDILTTPVGSRVMRRDYGSDLRRMVDSGVTQGTKLAATAATALALERWEPRFRFAGLDVQASPGGLEITVSGEYLPKGEPIIISGVEIE